MNDLNDTARIRELSEKTGIEMIVIAEAEKITRQKADRYKRRFIRSHYADDPIKSSLEQQSPKTATVELPGISFLLDENGIDDFVDQLNKRFAYRNCHAFIQSRENRSANKAVVSLICSTDKYNILRYQQVSGGSYLDSTENIIAGLQTLEKKFPFNLVGVGSDWCLLQLKQLPVDWINLSEEVLKVCSTDQDTPEEFAKALQAGNGEIYLWWD